MRLARPRGFRVTLVRVFPHYRGKFPRLERQIWHLNLLKFGAGFYALAAARTPQLTEARARS